MFSVPDHVWGERETKNSVLGCVLCHLFLCAGGIGCYVTEELLDEDKDGGLV